MRKMCKIGLFGAHPHAVKIKPAELVTSHVKWMELAQTIKLPNTTPGCLFTVFYCCPMMTQSQDISCLIRACGVR